MIPFVVNMKQVLFWHWRYHEWGIIAGLMIAVVQGRASEDVLEKAWGPERLDIPMAPGLGLMLASLHYDYYNKRYGSDGVHEPLEWSSIKVTEIGTLAQGWS